MAGQRRTDYGRVGEYSKREVRADRILDAAAELIERWGYNKTTIDDIAHQAGVAKGTIYLHWKTRDDLFWALLRREDVRLAEAITQNISNDPEGMTMYSFTKHSMLCTMKNPLAKAMLLMDSQMLGQLARRDYSSASYPDRLAGFTAFLLYMRDQGVIRADLAIEKHIYMLSAIMTGFLLIDQYMPGDFKYSYEEIAEMAAESVQRTLEPRSVQQANVDVHSKRTIARAFASYMDQALETMKNELQNEEEVTS